MISRYFQLAFLLVLTTTGKSQTTTDKWDLQRCVQYAFTNNISVRQADLQSRFSELTYKQNRAAQYPNLNLSSSAGYNFGRSENPTTGVLVDNNFLNAGVQMQSQVNLFNFFSQRRTIESSEYSWQADKEQVKKAQDDVAINVAVAYLQILLGREQTNITAVQIQQTTAQLEITRKRVDAGTLPELNAAELEAQLARDSAAYVTAGATVQQYILQMKALLNLDAGQPFDIVTPVIRGIPIEPLAELQPELVFASAMANLPQQKVNQLRLLAAQKNVAANKATLYPTISAFGSLSSNYVNTKLPIGSQVIAPTNAYVNVAGLDYFVQAPSFVQTGERSTPLGKQLSNNFSQNIGIGLRIPIFNGRAARTNWDRSKLQVKQWELTNEQDTMTLKQDIYRAYNDATAALNKFSANKKAVETSQRAYDYAQKRYEVALLSTLELLTSQNNLLRARIDLLYTEYDYIFKMKLLEFYKGQGIKL